MDSVPVGSPSTPNRATSAGPSPPRRNPMEDADSSVTRKRPRLDSGSLAHANMSADNLRAVSSGPEASQDSPSPAPRDNRSPLANEPHGSLAGADGTPSKVTINFRDPVQMSSPPLPISNGGRRSLSQGQEGSTMSRRAGSSGRGGSSTSNVISVSSSPPRSPEIEVAEVEDMNEESGETRWRPLVTLVDAKDTQGALLEAFPYVDSSRDLRQTVALIAQVFEKRKPKTPCEMIQCTDSLQESLENGELFKRLSDWIEMYLQTTEAHSAQWWSMYLEEREFWDDLPSIIDSLVRRR